jgi:nucleotide-binding universal stress UspA family protein
MRQQQERRSVAEKPGAVGGEADALRRVHIVEAWAPERRHADLVVGYGHGGETSQAALQVAGDLARRLKAHLHVVHAIDLGDYPIDPDADEWEESARTVLAKEQDEVRTMLEGHLEGWSYHAAHGRPAELLAAVADEHDALLVVVGSGGQGLTAALGRFMGGSTSHGLIHHCGRPVLVVPHSDAVPTTRSTGAKARHLFRHPST